MIVHHIDPLRDPRWAELVERHARASVFHTPGWLEALRRTYRYEPVAYTTTRPGIELANGVVFCRVYSRITGRRMVSLPFSDHCEPLVDRAEDMNTLAHALEFGLTEERWKYIELRPRTDGGVAAAGWERGQMFHFHTLDLTSEPEEFFSRFHKDSTQRKIRRAEREGVTSEEGRNEAILGKFYQLLLGTRRRQHLPPQPYEWFRNLVDCLGDHVNIRVAAKDGRPIASILTLTFRNSLVYKYGCSDERFHNLGGMQLLFWKAIQGAKGHQAREFDLGRSDADNRGLVTFKDRWGAARSQLTYWRYPAPLAPAVGVSWGTRMAMKTFAHLPPRLAMATGKMLYRHVG